MCIAVGDNVKEQGQREEKKKEAFVLPRSPRTRRDSFVRRSLLYRGFPNYYDLMSSYLDP